MSEPVIYDRRSTDRGLGGRVLTIEERLAVNTQRMDEIWTAMEGIKSEQLTTKELLTQNTATTDQVQTNTKELLEVFDSWKGAMRVLEMLGKAAKPLGYIVMLCTALFGAVTAVKSGVNIK